MLHFAQPYEFNVKAAHMCVSLACQQQVCHVVVHLTYCVSLIGTSNAFSGCHVAC